MPQSQQTVKCILTIERLVRPMAVEAAFVRPESIDVVKAALLHAAKGDLQSGERVQRRRCREQVRQRGVGRRPEAALGMTAREQPIANGIIYWDRQIPQQSDRRG